ncbi:MAG: hypothetical protein U9R15_16140, partial [Chloroflexota bacterium]|nr:hypothetical protein [Chloroflexota bacterium]
MRHSRLLISIALPLAALGLFLAAIAAPSQAAILPGDTVIPLGPAQPDVRTAYRDALSHLYGGGRVHWAAAPFGDGTLGFFGPGDFVIPGGLSTAAGHVNVTTTMPLSRAYALRAGGVALLRSTVVVTEGQNQYVAMWELAEMRQFLDGYLVNALPYTVLDEADVAAGELAGLDLLIVPAIRADAVLSVTNALDEAGALDAIREFVQAGGTLYAQSNGAYVAEATGLLPEGTVDLETIIELDAEAEPNTGRMEIQMADSPLAWSWLTDTLYILTDPVLHPGEGMDVIATLANASLGEGLPTDPPAIIRATPLPTEGGDAGGGGQIILVAGHPTDEARRLGAPVFMDAILSALASRAELTG